MSRRKQPTPQMLDENKTVSNNAILPDAKSDNFSMGSENSELSEKGKDTRSTQLSNANSTNLTPDSTSETRKKSLSEENNRNVSQSNRQNSSQNQEDFNGKSFYFSTIWLRIFSGLGWIPKPRFLKFSALKVELNLRCSMFNLRCYRGYQNFRSAEI